DEYEGNFERRDNKKRVSIKNDVRRLFKDFPLFRKLFFIKLSMLSIPKYEEIIYLLDKVKSVDGFFLNKENQKHLLSLMEDNKYETINEEVFLKYGRVQIFIPKTFMINISSIIFIVLSIVIKSWLPIIAYMVMYMSFRIIMSIYYPIAELF